MGGPKRSDRGRHLQHLKHQLQNPLVETLHSYPHPQGGDPDEMRNWRRISQQLTIYKLYAAIIARRIGSWATATSSSPAQEFLIFEECAEHYFLLRSMLTDPRRRKHNLVLTWLDIREAFTYISPTMLL